MGETNPYMLGISAFYHDSAACLLVGGKVIAAAQEERFTRKKHDPAFPQKAVDFCLRASGIGLEDVGHIAFYEKPLLKFERLLETYYRHAPKGLPSFLQAMPVWMKEKMALKKVMTESLQALTEADWSPQQIEWYFPEHHLSHAASAFYPSPFEEAAILTLDGVGEHSTTTFGIGKGQQITELGHIDFPHSLGLLYSAFTYFTGFKVNSGEYKLMGLAPYGQPLYQKLIFDKLIEVKEDGSFRLNTEYFTYETGLRMTGSKFANLFDGAPRKPESPITQRECDLAASVQAVVEDVVVKMGRFLKKETGKKQLVMAGGVALNCVANGKLWREGLFENIWVQPAAGDAGGALGAALAAWHIALEKDRRVSGTTDAMKGALLGPSFPPSHVAASLQAWQAVSETLEEEGLMEKVATLLAEGKVVGWFQGMMEFGPRALGNRSILADPRHPNMQSQLNLKIKFRESFRPFAPIVLEEYASEYFGWEGESPYMLMVAPVRGVEFPDKKGQQGSADLQEMLKAIKSPLPAITHVDGSARLQTVDAVRNPKLHRLLEAFYRETKCPVLVNTSFNVRGEPIVCTPRDAYRCFMATGMDVLVIGNLLFEKTRQPLANDARWKQDFAAD